MFTLPTHILPPSPMMPLSAKLERNLRAADDTSDGEEFYEVTDRSSSASVMSFASGQVLGSENEDDEMVRHGLSKHDLEPPC